MNRQLTTGLAALLVVLHAGVLTRAVPGLDLTPIGARLHRLQAEDRAVAHLGKYHGQYTFPGRLRAPLEIVGTGEDLGRWARAHPGGRVVAYDDQLPGGTAATPEFEQPFRGRNRVQIWEAVVLAGLLPAANATVGD